MKTYKVCFLSHHFESPKTFLESIIKMTPDRTGKWKNIEAVTDPKEADFYAIFDGYNRVLPEPENKAIYFSQHPYTPSNPHHKLFDSQIALLKLPLTKYLNPGEWWIEYDYDTLVALEPPEKSKSLICIMTYQMHTLMYAQRTKFISTLVKSNKEMQFDLYGRPPQAFQNNIDVREVYRGVLGMEKYDALKGEHIVGKNIIKDYKYSIEMDVGPCTNYFSERFYDALLLWTFPFYFGCTNLTNYIPAEAFQYFNINGNGQDIIQTITEANPINYKALGEARDLLLNKYQTWAYVHQVVNNIGDYKNG